MLTMVERFSGPALEIMDGAKSAAAHIPPLWGLDATVAVNPYVGQAGEPLQMAAARLAGTRNSHRPWVAAVASTAPYDSAVTPCDDESLA